MKCKICGGESGKYPLCFGCNIKKEKGEIIKCEKCGNWHYTNIPCPIYNIVVDSDKYLYDVRKPFISKSEQDFYNAIKSSVPDGFYVFPQINLATFIDKTDDSKFHNELFRNVDFLVTDEKYTPKFVIEINDQTHLINERRKRDEKVQKICEEAGIPIIIFWTSYGINLEYIKSRIDETLSTLPVSRVHHFNQTSDTEQPNPHISYHTRKHGCYVATCIYGSYDCPEVWILRRYRDTILANNFWGRIFIKIYYVLSPSLVKYFGKYNWFVSVFKLILDKFVIKLQMQGFESAPYNDKN